jgi:hypothetical protein
MQLYIVSRPSGTREHVWSVGQQPLRIYFGHIDWNHLGVSDLRSFGRQLRTAHFPLTIRTAAYLSVHDRGLASR